jgi:tRNA A-37 threonylcarbamoyl transferase component Bud32
MSDASHPNGSSSAVDLSGRQFGDFRLLRRLGRGAMAEVYLAEQCSLGRQVAVKVLKTELARDQTYVKRFQREAQAAASLVHANIVQIHEVGCVEDLYYIAQEYVQGVNLRQWLARHGPADLKTALIIMRQVAAALAKAAQQGIVHRDIKPENIMLTQSCEVKVADFGLARFAGPAEGLDLTQVGMTLGTPLYMSPEQVEGKALDPRSDLYSFGVTCYAMLAGSPPFGGDTALGVAVQHLKKSPQPLEDLRPDLPPALCRVVHRMLAKEPEKRFPSPRELLRELRRIQTEFLDEEWPEELPGWETVALEAADTSRAEATGRLDALMKTSTAAAIHRRRWAWWAAACLAAFLFGGLIAWLTTREAPLLTGAQAETLLAPKQETVFRQWLYASQVGTEDAWKAVIEYFPDKPYFGYRAKQQLAKVYLREDRLDEALAVFDELAALDETEEELRAFGLAGRCGVLTIQGKHQESAATLAELWPLRSRLKDPLMWRMLQYTVNTNRSKLGPMTTRQWNELLNQRPSQSD